LDQKSEKCLGTEGTRGNEIALVGSGDVGWSLVRGRDKGGTAPHIGKIVKKKKYDLAFKHVPTGGEKKKDPDRPSSRSARRGERHREGRIKHTIPSGKGKRADFLLRF